MLIKDWIIQLTESDAIIYDLVISGLEYVTDLDQYLERLAFRLGKSFNCVRLRNTIDVILRVNYNEYEFDSKKVYIHKESDLDPKFVESLIKLNNGSSDLAIINSLFGEIFYWRD